MPKVKALSPERRFGEYLRKKRRYEDITQRYLAAKLGITQQGYQYKEEHGSFTISEMITVLREVKATDFEILDCMKGRM